MKVQRTQKLASVFLITMLALTFSSLAMSPLSRELHGRVEGINQEEHILTIKPDDQSAARRFHWEKRTRFFEGNKSMTPDQLTTGIHVEARYRAPFFGPKVVTQVRLNYLKDRIIHRQRQ